MRNARALLFTSCLVLFQHALPFVLRAEGTAAADQGEGERSGVSNDVQPARVAFEAGRVALDAGRFETALAHFELAYELEQHPLLLFNIARAAEFGGRRQRAIEAYTAYLMALPRAENRDFVRARVEQLRSESDDPAAAVATPREAASSAMVVAAPAHHEDKDVASRPLWKRGWLWAAVGVAVAGGVTTALLLTRESGADAGDDVDLRVQTLVAR